MTGEIKEYSTVNGIRLAAVASGIRYPDRLDLVLMEIAADSSTSAVFTRNQFCAAPVSVSKSHLKQAEPRYLLINTGNANAGTGEEGKVDALVCCQALADLAGVSIKQILPFSTGVIGERLPTEPIRIALPAAYTGLNGASWPEAAEGILTTDTRPKLASRELQMATGKVTIVGMAKGAGMIKPNMATMLAFVATDTAIERQALDSLLNDCVEQSFNRITVDGDTSTNDACVLSATGKSGVRLDPANAEWEVFTAALRELFQELAMGLIRDAEGASKFITLQVSGGSDSRDCLKVAYAVAESPLVKTAMFASDANWGRILAAVGRAGVEGLVINSVNIDLGHLALVRSGSVAPDYSDEAGQAVMAAGDIAIHIDLGMGQTTETVWTTDLSHDYVRINADYRT